MARLEQLRPCEIERGGVELHHVIADNRYMIDRGIKRTGTRAKSLGNESVHGLPLDWPELKRNSKAALKRRRDALLATQNVHGLPTRWNELDLSE